MSDASFYLTTPIYYVNAAPHVGHAYTSIMSDIIARHRRQRGEQVFFLTGTDEHGTKIAQSAADAGRSPREHADALSDRFREMNGVLGISNDFFMRTTLPEHAVETGHFLEKMREAGDVYRDSYGGWYCVASESFYPENEWGEGKTCPIHGTPLEWVEEENWFFRLSAFQDRLLAFYDAHPDFVLPRSRQNEARSMVEHGLEDLSISRAQLDWGITVPWDPEQVIYVWIEALLNYWTAPRFMDSDLGPGLWPASLQLMAKDILKFHAVIWPAMLMSAGEDPPEQLFIHGYVLKGGERMSKTTGNVVDPFPFIETYGIDPLRYYLAREIRFGEDGTFTHEGFDARYEGELANEFGNLLNRTVNMVSRYRDGVVPADPGGDDAFAAEVSTVVDAVRDHFEVHDVTRGAEAAWALIRSLNQLVEQRAPWKLAKDPEASGELDQALYTLAEGLRVAALLLWPFMPGSCESVLKALGQDPSAVGLDTARIGAGVARASVTEIPPLFPKIEASE